MRNLFAFSLVIVLFANNIFSDYEYVLSSCRYSNEFVDITINTKDGITAVTDIFGPDNDEDPSWVTVLNPQYIYDANGGQIYSASSFDKATEISGSNSQIRRGSKFVYLNFISDIKLGTVIMQIKILSEQVLTNSDKNNIRLFLREFGYSNPKIFNGSVVESFLYSGCKVSKTRDYNKEAEEKRIAIEEEKKLKEKNEIEKKKIELEKLKLEAQLRKKQIDELKPEIIGSGTGFYINKEGHIATNFHVIDKCEFIKSNGAELKVIASDPINDISILNSNIVNENYIKLSSSTVIKGQDIYVIGYPYGTFLSGGLLPQSKTTKGIVSSLQGLNNFYNWFQMDASIQPGNSGGPIIDDEGYLKGITVASADYKVIFEAFENLPQNINYGIKVDILKNILEANEISYESNADSGIFDFFFAESFEEIIKDADKATLYIECWAKDIPEE